MNVLSHFSQINQFDLGSALKLYEQQPPGPPDPGLMFNADAVSLNPQPLPPGPPDPDGGYSLDTVSLNPQPLPPGPPDPDTTNVWNSTAILRDTSAPQWLMSALSNFSTQFEI